jgi:hypothetical protein
VAGQRFEFTPLNPEGEPDIWADFDNLTINIGLWRSPLDRLGEIPVSTKDKQLQVAIDISEN